MMGRSTVIFLAMVGLFDSRAAAQDVGVPDLTTYRFDDDFVDGGRTRPGLEVLHVGPQAKGKSLVRVREHFIAELLKSIEQL